MTTGGFLLFLIITPPLAVIAGWLGRKYQRFIWMMDRPYAERVAGLKSWKKAA